MSKKGWLSREDFDKLDELFGKLGYGGYYDFLECLKTIASNLGAVYVFEHNEVQAWDLQDVKTVSEAMNMINVWSNKISNWMDEHPEWIDEVLKFGS